ncbi:hypothetical protein [Lewinella sp. IMCC34191]|uniref:hypothetical protein n=1 Tax=Lewinella sp. IMCC34191 TaxID=2259172 RepID=UPI0013002972|nr:hypothetical protein [Lewinella sp. IMCC34191]
MLHRIKLLLFLVMPLGLFAQVGVNTTEPEQALDVNGKIQVGDDAMAPTAGTMRYNGSEADFQGYDGKDWKSFTNSSSDGLPGTTARYITAYSPNISPEEIATVYFETRDDNSRIITPPAGQYLLITSINVMPNFFTFSPERFALAFFSSSASDSGFGDRDNGFRMTGNLAEQNFITSETPIMVIGPGEYLRIEASRNNEATVNINLRGFLVDSLDY